MQKSVFIVLVLTFVNILVVCEPNEEHKWRTQVILVGATGDLAKKYLWKGLFELYKEHSNAENSFELYGAARVDENKGNIQLRDILNAKIQCESNDHLECAKLKKDFLQNTKYIKLKRNEDYQSFCKELNTEGAENIRRIFYLSVPPFAYSAISKNIHLYCRPKLSSHLRVVFEKPFGADLESAKELVSNLEDYFSEEEIYRVDHYLGKTGVSQILDFRHEHRDAFSMIWNSGHVQSVEIALKEKGDCRDRTEFYNKYGVIRDVMQNHMTELMVLTAMDLPYNKTNKNEFQIKKLKFLDDIEPLHPYSALIGQYKSYRKHCEEERGGTNTEDMTTPTFAAVMLKSRNSKWNQVPFLMVSGKQLDERSSFVKISFNREYHITASQSLCQGNRQIIFHIQGGQLQTPALIISKALPKITKFSNWIPLDAKPDYLYGCPGNSFDVFVPPVSKDAYTVLIKSVFLGQKEHFVGTQDLLASWRIWSPLITTLTKTIPTIYSKDNLKILDFKITGKRLEFTHELGCSSDDVCQTEDSHYRYIQRTFRENRLVTGSRGKVVKNLAQDILHRSLDAVSSNGAFHMALSGGSTPLYLFEQLSFLAPDFPWHATHIWFVDERCYPYTNQQSNFNFISKNLLNYVPIPVQNVHGMPVAMQNGLCSPLDKGPELYEYLIRNTIKDSSLDYVVLGVGTDGHTASLFPNNNFFYTSTKNWVVFSESKVMQPTGLRMSLTLEVFSKAKAVSVLILGEKKADIVRKIEGNNFDFLPISSLKVDNGDLVWYIDDAAYRKG